MAIELYKYICFENGMTCVCFVFSAMEHGVSEMALKPENDTVSSECLCSSENEKIEKIDINAFTNAVTKTIH